MKVLLDMNMGPNLVPFLKVNGYEASHWSIVGDPKAEDSEILAWALANDFVVLTHDLDFTAILASTNANGPSVIQVRTQDIYTDSFKNLLIDALKQFQPNLTAGAIIVIDDKKARARILPLR